MASFRIKYILESKQSNTNIINKINQMIQTINHSIETNLKIDFKNISKSTTEHQSVSTLNKYWICHGYQLGSINSLNKFRIYSELKIRLKSNTFTKYTTKNSYHRTKHFQLNLIHPYRYQITHSTRRRFIRSQSIQGGLLENDPPQLFHYKRIL